MKRKNIEKKIYESLGINFFRKYILFSWEKICKIFNFDPGYRIASKNIKGLKKYKKLSIGFANSHLLVIVLAIILGILNQASIVFFIVHILINSYCIMTQRYNIIRIDEIIEKHNKLEKNKTKKLIENNNKIINNICEIKNRLESNTQNKYLSKSHVPVINDDIISLSVSNVVSASEINDRSFECFDIILNETKEKIGNISFDYYTPKHEFGNVSYEIDDQFQNKGYATRALKLLVNLLKNNNYKGDKDLYFWVSYYNEYSKKVVLNNGGEIVSGGESETKSPYRLRIKI